MPQTSTSLLSPEEIGRLFTDYKPRLMVIAYSYVRDMGVAEDLVADSFISFWERKDQLPEGSNIHGYLLCIVKNACLMYLRRQQVHSRAENELYKTASWEIQCSIDALENSEPMNRLLSSDVAEIFRRELDALPELTRQIFLASREESLTYLEIAAKYGVSVRKVTSEIQRALEILRVSLKDYLPAALVMFYFFREK